MDLICVFLHDLLLLICDQLSSDDIGSLSMITFRYYLIIKEKSRIIAINKLRNRTKLKLELFELKELIHMTRIRKFDNHLGCSSLFNYNLSLIKNNKGQLYKYDRKLKLILNNIIQLVSGRYYSLALTDTGSVYKITKHEHNLIFNLTRIVQVAVGYDHALLLTSQGKIYSFGSNCTGGLGHENEVSYQNDPILIPGLKDIIQIEAGHYYSMALNANGKVYFWYMW